MLNSINPGFNEERKEIYAPKISITQLEVWEELYKLCWGDDRFDGPGLEYRTSQCSLDIFFIKRDKTGVKKIGYEIDCDKWHDPERDEKRDWYLFKNHDWLVFRVNCEDIDLFGPSVIARQIYSHLMYHLGFVKTKDWLPGVITSYTSTMVH